MKRRLKEMERTRHLLVWHDLSTVAYHSHLVFMATCLYDPATFYTNSEYEAMTGRKINIQSLVESPSLYIVADLHHLMKINCAMFRLGWNVWRNFLLKL